MLLTTKAANLKRNIAKYGTVVVVKNIFKKYVFRTFMVECYSYEYKSDSSGYVPTGCILDMKLSADVDFDLVKNFNPYISLDDFKIFSNSSSYYAQLIDNETVVGSVWLLGGQFYCKEADEIFFLPHGVFYLTRAFVPKKYRGRQYFYKLLYEIVTSGCFQFESAFALSHHWNKASINSKIKSGFTLKYKEVFVYLFGQKFTYRKK